MLKTLSPQPSLTRRVSDDVRAAIQEGAFGRDGRLPSEPELARQLGVSRATMRHAMAILEDEGLINRRQGMGTFVVEPVRELRSLLNSNFGVTELIEAAGWTPGVRDLCVVAGIADQRVARELRLRPRSRVVTIQRVRTADDRPVLYTMETLPLGLLARHGTDGPGLESMLREEQSLYLVLDRLGIQIHHGIATLRAVALDEASARALELDRGTPALIVEQVDFDAGGEPVALSHEYYPSLTVQVYRKGPGPGLTTRRK
jgi:GntR family transcriptional regulator